MAEKPRIGFIGLGLMGQGFTQRLVERGYAVTGYDIDAAKIETAAAHGVAGAASPAEVAAASDIIHICVMETASVEAVIFGDDGITQAAEPGKIVVDHSTTVLAATRQIAARLDADHDMGFLDAPVSGGPPAARAGTLAMMVGGAAAVFDKVEPVLRDVATGVTHFGPAGAGQVAKMVNQILVLNNYVLLAEALALAEAGGIDAAKIPEALGPGYAGSNMLHAMFPRLIERDYAPAGYARQVLKDFDMLHDLSKALKCPTPMSAQATSLYRMLISKGHGELDAISILKLFDGKDTV